MDLAAWDRCKCLLRPPSTSGYATKPPSSSPGEPGEGAGLLELELASPASAAGPKAAPEAGPWSGPSPPSVQRRRGSNQPSTNLGGLLPVPLLRRPAWDCRRRGRKTEFGELNYLSEEGDVPSPFRLLRLGVSRGGPSRLFCQTQGATERELPGREGKVGLSENRPGREKLEEQWGYTQRVTFVPRIPRAQRGDVALPLGQATAPQRESLRAAGPEGSPPARPPVQRRVPGPGTRPGCAGTGRGVPNPAPPETWGIGAWSACAN